jgi:outer membrane lipoprotein SlyB
LTPLKPIANISRSIIINEFDVMRTNWHLIIMFAATGLAVATSGCQSLGPNAAQSGAFGGLTGSVAGAAIGASEGKAAEGALIGGLTGATVGTVAGDAVDRQIERERAEFQQFQNEQRQAAITTDQIIQMTHSGLSSDVIARQIHNQGVVNHPSINELILLKNQGVDDLVINAMQSAPIAGHRPPAAPRCVPACGPPVIVEHYAPFPRYSPGWCYRRRPRTGVGFTFGF